MDKEEFFMSEKEQAIYNGLHSFRPEIAMFYKDGLLIKKMDLSAKSNILAHLLREIDGGLRDVFEKDKKKEVTSESLKQLLGKFKDDFHKFIRLKGVNIEGSETFNHIDSILNSFESEKEEDIKVTSEFLKQLFQKFKDKYHEFTYLKNVSGGDFKTYTGHVNSILDSFGLEKNSLLAEQYIMLAVWFHKYAHRNSESINGPREEADIIKIWEQFEEVLLALVGSLLSEINLIDRLVRLPTPSSIEVARLPYLFKDQSKKIFFFRELKEPGWLEPLYKAGYFAGKNNPKPVKADDLDFNGYYYMPMWPEFFSVFQIVKILPKKGSGVWKTVVKIIDEVVTYRDEVGERVVNWQTDNLLIGLIALLPDKYLDDRHLGHAEQIVKSNNTSILYFRDLIERLVALQERSFLVRCLNMYFEVREVPDPFTQESTFVRVFNPLYYQNFMYEHIENMTKICGAEGFEMLFQRLEVVKNDYDIWGLSTMGKDDSQNHYKDDYPSYLAFFVIDYLLVLDDEVLPGIITRLAGSDSVAYKRIAYHMIDKRYDLLKNIFWSNEHNPMDDYECRPEIYRLFSTHCQNFSPEEISTVLKWVESTQLKRIEGQDYTEAYIASLKKSWVLPLKNIENNDVQEYIKELEIKAPYHDEHPEYNSYSGARALDYPVPLAEMEVMSVGEIAELYKPYDTNEGNYVINIGQTELTEEFKVVVKKDVVRFSTDVGVFADVPIVMQYDWITGLWGRNDKKLPSDFSEVFGVVYQILDNKAFEERFNKAANQMNYYRWFVSNALMLISEIQGADSFRFSKETLPVIKKVLLLLYERYGKVGETKPFQIDTMAERFKLQLYENLLLYNYHFACSEEKNEEERWDAEVKGLVEAGLNSKELNPDLFFAVCRQCHRIMDIDKNWFVRNLEAIFPVEQESNCYAAVAGFHSRYPAIIKPVFLFLKEKGYYTRLIERADDCEPFFTEQFTDTICLAYLLDWLPEGIEDNVFQELICSKNKRLYEYIIRFFQDFEDERYFAKIRCVWERLYHICHKGDGEAELVFMQKSFILIKFFDSIDEELEQWLMASIQSKGFKEFHDLLVALFPLVENSPEACGRVLLENIRLAKDYFGHPGLAEFVDKLFQKGVKQTANDICNLCAKKKDFALKEVFDRYNR